MIESYAAWPLLTGLRGQPLADLDALATALSRPSLFAAAYAIESLDITPFLVHPDGALVLDAVLASPPHPMTVPAPPPTPRLYTLVPDRRFDLPLEEFPPETARE